MTDNPKPLAFLDANVLAKPVTRTLLIYASNRSDYRVVWSQYVEDEADRNRRTRQVETGIARLAARIDLTPTAVRAGQYVDTKPSDRQVLADAAVAGASFIVTEDVDDFGEVDLIGAGIMAVNPDLFLAERCTREGYAEAVDLMAANMTNPHRTSEELHARLGRQHPRTVATYRHVFGSEPLSATQGPPAVLYRGNRCLRCLRHVDAISLGICDACLTLRLGHPIIG